jgi:hypothetical protein
MPGKLICNVKYLVHSKEFVSEINELEDNDVS